MLRKRGCAALGSALLLLLVLAFPDRASARELRIDVALPESAPDPIGDALQLAREHRKANPDDAIVIQLQAAIYRREGVIDITAQDSGHPSGALILRGSDDGDTVISGAKLAPAALDAPAGDAPAGARVISLANSQLGDGPSILRRGSYEGPGQRV